MIGANVSSRTALAQEQVDPHRAVVAFPEAAPVVTGSQRATSFSSLSLRGEVLRADALTMLLPAWEDLCGRAVEDNVYYSPRYARALLESVDSDKDVGVAVVWDSETLIAFLPFTRAMFGVPGIRPSARAWETKYTYSCTPLLDRVRKSEAAEALVGVMESISKSEWIVPSLNVKGEACEALVLALEQREVPWGFSNRFSRAVLEAGRSFEEHLKRHVSSNRRKGLARNRRRLEELGPVAHECHCSGEGLERAVSAFLAIEASGWKGKRRTALACDERTRKFAIDAFTGDKTSSICRADVLTLNGTPIAVSLIALAGRTGFTVKAAYDESYRSYAAGLLLELEVVRSFLSGNWASKLDGATAGDHVLDGLWSGRNEVADLIFSLSPRFPALRLLALQATVRGKVQGKAGLKQLMTWLRGS